jgi:hypothetical protein
MPFGQEPGFINKAIDCPTSGAVLPHHCWTILSDLRRGLSPREDVV